MRASFQVIRPLAALACAAWLGLSSASVVSAESLIYLTLRDVQIGGNSAQILVPSVLEASAPTGQQCAQVVFNQLKLVAPTVYGAASLSVDSNFQATQGVSVKADGVTGAALERLVAEVHGSMILCGVRQVRISPLGELPVGADRVSLATMQPVVPGWQALSPARWSGALVRLPSGNVMTTDAFYAALAKGDKGVSQDLLTYLERGNVMARAGVAAGISQLSLSDVVGTLIPLLSDSSSDVKLSAIASLDMHRSDAKVNAALVKAVEEDADPAVKSAAVRVLIAAGNRKYEVFALFDKLKDPNERVVMDAVTTLSSSGNKGAASGLVEVLDHSTIDIREVALAGLISLGNAEAMSRALERQTVAMAARLKIAKAMTGLSEQSAIVEGLSFLVANGNAADAVAAAEALGKLKAKGGTPALTAALASGNGGLRQAAATALGEIGDPAAISALAQMAANNQAGDAGVADGAAVTILRKLSLSEVIEKSKDPDAAVRRFALMALSGFAEGARKSTVIGVLMERLRDTDAKIRRAAAFALARIEDESVASALLALKSDSDAAIRAQVATAMSWSTSSAAQATLVELLKDGASEVKLQAAKGVERKQIHEALEALLQYVNYGKVEVRRAIMAAIVAIARPEDNERLLQIYPRSLYDADTQVKLTAIEGISRIRDPRSLTGLSGLVIDPAPEVQILAITKLGQFKDPNATEHIAKALFSPQKEVKVAAIEALGVSGQENAQKPLQEFITNEGDQELRAKAEQVYDTL